MSDAGRNRPLIHIDTTVEVRPVREDDPICAQAALNGPFGR